MIRLGSKEEVTGCVRNKALFEGTAIYSGVSETIVDVIECTLLMYAQL